MHKKLLLFIFFISYYSASAQAIPEQEREVLIVLYTLTGGPNWTSNSGWLGDVGTECSWSGVSCSDKHVVRLNLNNRGLTGSIPKILSYLDRLKELDLSNNRLNGIIPIALGSGYTGLTSGYNVTRAVGLNLEVLHLHNNQLSGHIPTELVNSQALKTLTLHNNKLTGKIYNCEAHDPNIHIGSCFYMFGFPRGGGGALFT